jgi:hypothetical protein
VRYFRWYAIRCPLACGAGPALTALVPPDPYIREKFTRSIVAARQLAREYFERYPKDQYETVVETWREIQSFNIEFTVKRRREPLMSDSDPADA